MIPMLFETLAFATRMHGDQKRLYTKEPYMVHPIAVGHALSELPLHANDCRTPMREPMTLAGILHDVLEDTPATEAEVMALAGPDVLSLVKEVTNVPNVAGNHEQRKAMDKVRLAGASNRAKIIKLADIADNMRTVVRHDPDWAKEYLPEKWDLLKVLRPTDDPLSMWVRTVQLISREALKIGISLPD